MLKAWTSGGIEFNWSPGIIGHSVFSESPTWIGRIDTARGPVLRAWEYDRRNASVWQVDIFLDNETLFLHPKLTPTRGKPLQGYWWTCVAVPATPETRVLTPAEWTAQTGAGAMRKAYWPTFAMGDANTTFSGHSNTRQTDNSWLGAVTSGDYFMGPLSKIPDTDPRYIAWTQEDGFCSYHGHPNNGTKFFTWGQNGAGRFMQDFLGGIGGPEPIADKDRVGDYTELQTGPAFTQMQTFDVPAAGKEWTEFFGAFDGNAKVLRGDDYDAALSEVSDARKTAVSNDRFGDVDKFLRSIADVPVDEVLRVGMPWGGVEQARKKSSGPLAPGVFFNASRSDPEARPWLELAQDGAFSSESLARAPLSFQIGDEWLSLLHSSVESNKGTTWLHELHLGVMYTERGEVDVPLAHFNRSFGLRPSVVAARSMAVLQQTATAAWPYFQLAWKVAVSDKDEPPQVADCS